MISRLFRQIILCVFLLVFVNKTHSQIRETYIVTKLHIDSVDYSSDAISQNNVLMLYQKTQPHHFISKMLG
jgi:hypothetical protein